MVDSSTKDVYMPLIPETCSPKIISFSPIEDEFFKYIDFFTPNETEAEFYVGKKIESYNQAKEAGEFFLKKGVKNSIITLQQQK